MKLASILPTKLQILLLLGAVILVALLGLASLYATWQFSFAIFYLLPIFMAVHFVGKWSGLLLSVFAGMTWLAVELQSNDVSEPLAIYWNGWALTGVFVIFSLLLASVEAALDKQKGITRNLEELLTLAPYDQEGWEMPVARPAPRPAPTEIRATPTDIKETQQGA
jgi:hypothetical protein